MARLSVLGPYVGPGEQITVETLARDLPSNWLVISGRNLPDRDRTDVDILIVSPSMIFVVEEKHWRGRTIIGHPNWIQNGKERKDPLGSVAYKSRKIVSHMQESVKGFRSYTANKRPVVPVVVLSHPEANIQYSGKVEGRIYTLASASGSLVKESESKPNFPGQLFTSICAYFEGCDQRDAKILDIGDYSVIEERAPVGRSRTFLAKNSQWDDVILRCHPLHGAGPGNELSNVFLRELTTLQELESAGQDYRPLPIFTDEIHQWLVTPFRERKNDLTLLEMETRRFARRAPLPTQHVATKVAISAFRALSIVHNSGITHRGLCPQRIRLGNGGVVSFSDFFLARLDGSKTLPTEAFASDIGIDFRAPECATNLHSAIQLSDVFSLAASLRWWATGGGRSSANDGRLSGLLELCISSKPTDRPSALDMVQRLEQSVTTTEEPIITETEPIEAVPIWDPGSTIDDRFELVRVLGNGAFAQSWLALDTKTQQHRVLKRFVSVESSAISIAEFNALSQINHRNCARTWDVLDIPPPGYLVNDYVEGLTLAEWTDSSEANVPALERIIFDVLDALDAVHQVGLVHRDVTPHNIIVRPNNSACLIDFGLCSAIGTVGLTATSLYRPPELASGMPYECSADLYGLGRTLQYCLSKFPRNNSTNRLQAVSDWMSHHDVGDRPLSVSDVVTVLKQPYTATSPTEANPQTIVLESPSSDRGDPTANKSGLATPEQTKAPTPVHDRPKRRRFLISIVSLALLYGVISTRQISLFGKSQPAITSVESSLEIEPDESITPSSVPSLNTTSPSSTNGASATSENTTTTSILAALAEFDLARDIISSTFTPSLFLTYSNTDSAKPVSWRARTESDRSILPQLLNGRLCPLTSASYKSPGCTQADVELDSSQSSSFYSAEFELSTGAQAGSWKVYLSLKEADQYFPTPGVLTVRGNSSTSIAQSTSTSFATTSSVVTIETVPTSQVPTTISVKPLDCTPSVSLFAVSQIDRWAPDQEDYGLGAIKWTWTGNACRDPNLMHLQIVCSSKWVSGWPVSNVVQHTTLVRWYDGNPKPVYSSDSRGPYWGLGKSNDGAFVYMFTAKNAKDMLQKKSCKARALAAESLLVDLIELPSILSGPSNDRFSFATTSSRLSVWVDVPITSYCSDWARPYGERFTYGNSSGSFYCDTAMGLVQIDTATACPSRQSPIPCAVMLQRKD